ncbi:MAG: aminotransferase class V-fold PLP-dependent enzyme [bacterium]
MRHCEEERRSNLEIATPPSTGAHNDNYMDAEAIQKIRQDFIIFKNKPDLVYFDNACSTFRPRQVVEAMDEYYNEYPACADRSEHQLGAMATKKVDEARAVVADFIGAKKDEIIFTRNTTEGINLVAHSVGLKDGDVVLTSGKEHNSNLLPWIVKGGIRHEIISDFEKQLKTLHPKIVALLHTSNLDGETLPVKEMVKVAHKYGALVLVDAAQAAGHQKINVRDLDCDFLAFSGHKMIGPTGTGVLYGKKKALENMAPFMLGGGTVSSSTYNYFTLLPVPERFEAGLQNYAGIIGLAEAIKYLKKVGFENIEAQEKQLNTIITQGLLEIPSIKILGPEDLAKRGGIISFYTDKLPSHQIMILLDKAGIAVRSGQFCVHSWFDANKIKDAVRASVYFYNTKEEAERFVAEMKKISKIF